MTPLAHWLIGRFAYRLDQDFLLHFGDESNGSLPISNEEIDHATHRAGKVPGRRWRSDYPERNCNWNPIRRELRHFQPSWQLATSHPFSYHDGQEQSRG